MHYVWDLANPPEDALRHFGARGRSLATLRRLGVPVPPGFAVSDVACRRFLEVGEFPAGMWEEVVAAVESLATAHPERPLLLSVRSSPPVAMAALLGGALHVGVNDTSLAALARWDSPEFAARVRIGFLRGVAEARRVPLHRVDAILSADQRRDPDGPAADAVALQELIVEESQRPLAPGVLDQLQEAMETVFASWDDEAARAFRRRNRISDDVGTSVVVHLMVFGSADTASGAGVAFSRDPQDGAPRPAGIFTRNASRPASVAVYPGLDDLATSDPPTHAELLSILCDLEGAERDMMRIDFVCERGDLWVLEARPGERSARAAVRIAVDMAEAGMITAEEAVLRIDPDGLDEMLHARIAPGTPAVPLISGGAASPGAASGGIVLDAERAVAASLRGEAVILVKRETTPEDLAGVIAARGVLTSHGGPTSHAAVAARGTGTPAVTGAAAVVCDPERRTVRFGTVAMSEGDPITIDGATGAVYAGALAIEEATASSELEKLLDWADRFRRLDVWANADTPDAAAHARRMGAEGVGLARTEYMFSGGRLEVVRRVILTDDVKERARALEELEELQIGDFERLLESMDGLPVVVRLLDPPLHEFLPDRWEVDAALRRAREAGQDTSELEQLQAAVDHWSESNPMLGLRGVRLAVVIPEIYRVQVLAALEAVRRRLDARGDPRLELMIPLVGTVEELRVIRDMIDEEVHYAGRQLEVTVGTMIELPRAALAAADFALESDFFSFGTNDLTQTTLGISRDDAEEAFLRTYLERGLMQRDPFTTLDRQGVGRLIEIAIEAGRSVNPGLVIGVCGEQGGDPDSIDFFDLVGVDYVSCSPPRLPVARLAAAQAALRHKESSRHAGVP